MTARGWVHGAWLGVVAITAACGQSGSPPPAASGSPSAVTAASAAPSASSAVRVTSAPQSPAHHGAYDGRLDFVDFAKLPASLLALRHERIVGPDTYPARAQAAVGAHYFCAGPHFPRLTMRPEALYASETLADTLRDRDALVAYLDCGTEAVARTGWRRRMLTFLVTTPGGPRAAEVQLMPGEPHVPATFTAADVLPPGLSALRCEHAPCHAGSRAVGRLEALGVWASADVATLRALADPKAPRLDPALVAHLVALRDVPGPAGDVLLASPRSLQLGFLDMAPWTNETDTARDAYTRVAESSDAWLLDRTPVDLIGPASLVVAPLSKAAEVARELEAVRLAAVSAKRSSSELPGVEGVYSATMEASVQRALAAGATRLDGARVRLDATLAHDDGEKKAMDRYRSVRAEHHEALHTILDARMRGEPAPEEALRRIGGARLVQMVKERTAAPVEGGLLTMPVPNVGVRAPAGAEITELPGGASLRYGKVDPATVDTLVALLTTDGYAVRVERLAGSGPWMRATKGDVSLRVAVIPMKTELLVRIVPE